MGRLLARIGWTKSHFAKQIKVSPDTVTRWKDDPPRVVILYLELLAQQMRV